MQLPSFCLLCHAAFTAAQINLGRAAPFAILSGSGVTNTGSSKIIDDVGTGDTSKSASLQERRLGSFVFAGAGTGLLTDATATYNAIRTHLNPIDLTDQNLGNGRVLGPGTYKFSSSAQLTGTLNLVGAISHGPFYFQIETALTTNPNAFVLLGDMAEACNVFWQVGSSATLGTGTSFQGAIFANAGITVTTAATTVAGLFTLSGSVTLDTNFAQVAVCPIISSSSTTSAVCSGTELSKPNSC